MIDDFLTSPNDLPSLRSWRKTPRAAAVDDASVAIEPSTGPTLAASLLLAMTMLGLPASQHGSPSASGPSKSSDDPARTY